MATRKVKGNEDKKKRSTAILSLEINEERNNDDGRNRR